MESYSRILESLAFTVLSRIEDVLYADNISQNPSQVSCERSPSKESPKIPGAREDNPDTPVTLLDFMGWGLDQGDAESKNSTGYADEVSNDDDGKLQMQKVAHIATNKKVSYLENLGGLRSPTARH